jgi:ligand-binding SRPBCC domain-containing protein
VGLSLEGAWNVGQLISYRREALKVHPLTQIQHLPITTEEAWAFFASPSKLSEITPADMGFELLGDHEGLIYEARILRYRISLAPGVKFHWTTEIKAVVPGHSFVDEQRSGPFAFWHHRHTFEPIDGGVKITDLIHYAVPFCAVGELFHPLLVRPKLERIFEYRRGTLEKRFGRLG